jgi:hypothetical protein
MLPSSQPIHQPISGRPPNSEFRDTIRDLAKQAREGDLKAEEEARRRNQRRPIHTFFRVGIALIVVQVALFAYLYTTGQRNPAAPEVTQKPPAKNCETVRHRTFWKVVAYVRDEGHPPASLDQMLGKYLDKLPTDPATGQRLGYSTDGAQHFELKCPGSAG